MGKVMSEYVDELLTSGTLDKPQFTELLKFRNIETTGYLNERARQLKSQLFGNQVTVLGRIMISNYCKNTCKMCGIRRDNRFTKRFRLSMEQILKYCDEFYKQGIWDILLESGEDSYLTEDGVAEILLTLRKKYPNLNITLSLGDRNKLVYRHWKQAGADGCIISHGSANDQHFKKIFPSNMSPLLKRQILWELKEMGYHVGSGFLIGLPYQTIDHVLEDIFFLKNFLPAYLSIGAFLPVSGSVFEKQRSGNGDMTIYIMSILRLILPNSHIIADPTLDCVLKDGRIKALDAGADVLLMDVSDLNLLNRYGVYARKNGRFGLQVDQIDFFKGQLGLRGISIS